MRGFFFIFLAIPLFSSAQSNFKEALLLTGQGDTLRGFIDYKEWHLSPDKVLFKEKLDDFNTQLFTVSNTNWFAVLGYESYVKSLVSISLNDLKFDNLREQFDTTTITKAVFLKELVKGDRVNLYSYNDELKERFYIKANQEVAARELIYRKALSNMVEQTEAVYRQQLLMLAVEFDVFTKEMDRLIQNANYSRSDIIKILNNINTRNEEGLTRILDKKRRTNFFLSIGINKSRIRYMGENLITIDRIDDMGRNKYKGDVSSQAYLPRFSAWMDHYKNPSVRRFVIRTELAATNMKSAVKSYYRYNNYSQAEIAYSYKFAAWNISFIPQALFHFYNTAGFKWYVGAGGSFNYRYVYNNHLHRKEVNQPINEEETINDYLPMNKFSLSTVINSGIQVKQRMTFFLVWGNPVEFTSFASGRTSVKSGLLAFSIAYGLRR
jgi:hypothetical protein